jgi:hypothetical protein
MLSHITQVPLWNLPKLYSYDQHHITSTIVGVRCTQWKGVPLFLSCGFSFLFSAAPPASLLPSLLPCRIFQPLFAGTRRHLEIISLRSSSTLTITRLHTYSSAYSRSHAHSNSESHFTPCAYITAALSPLLPSHLRRSRTS